MKFKDIMIMLGIFIVGSLIVGVIFNSFFFQNAVYHAQGAVINTAEKMNNQETTYDLRTDCRDGSDWEKIYALICDNACAARNGRHYKFHSCSADNQVVCHCEY